MSKMYDKEGNPIEMLKWGRLFADDGYKRVALDQVGDFTISTVWLGLDHRFGEGLPLIFETMVFEGDDMGGLEQERYSTEAEAKEGHLKMVTKYKNEKSKFKS